jgi:phospholipid/cholesterol/gamma-HCH transport system permease protein
MLARTIERVGRAARDAIEGLGRAGRFAAESALAVRDVRTWWPQAMPQAMELGVRSLPIGAFIAVFTGIVLALLASYSVSGAVPLYFVGTLVEKTVTMELAPVLTGLALAGRVGANIAAELGTMRVTEQIDALETLAYDSRSYLVVPRVLAGTIMFPVVVAVAMLIGVGSGWLASVALLDMSSPEFVKGLRLFFSAFDVRYGAAVTFVGCFVGINAAGGARGVGRAATRAVVLAATLILVLDAFWAVVLLTGREPL